jgi:hypothetical protein
MAMHKLERALPPQSKTWALASALITALGCAQQSAPQASVLGSEQALGIDDLAKQCKLECPERGIAEGNASISGVTSVDTFFQAVLDYQAKADNVSSSIEAQLTAIRGDFALDANQDISAALMAKIDANAEGGMRVDAEPARCTIDTDATIRAQAHCDASVKPGKVSCGCRGKCHVAASAKVECGAQAQLECTSNAALVSCEGKCQGRCIAQLDAAAACDGICRGSCSGKCAAYARNLKGEMECAGECDAQCTGRCESKLAAQAQCNGMCDGECTVVRPDASCEGGIRAQCTAMNDAMLDCRGRCEGEIEPPKAKTECEASAKAEAKLNVQCTPPRLAVKYKLKSSLDAMASAQFVNAASNLEVRLPALFAAIQQANSVTQAQAELIGDGNAAVKGAVNAALSDSGMLQVKLVGLGCALGQLDDVGNAIDKSSQRLSANLDASAKLQAALMGNNS